MKTIGSSKYCRIGPSRYQTHSVQPAASGTQNVQRTRWPATNPSASDATTAATATRASNRRNSSSASSVPATGAKNGSLSTCARALASSAANRIACMTMSALG